MSGHHCPICEERARRFRDVKGVSYYECARCDFIFADRELLDRIDAGFGPREYNDAYWSMELPAARERSYGATLALVAEALLYCRIDVERFVDIGTGPGYLLDALTAYLPASSSIFHGIELYPPPETYRSKHPNYHVGAIDELKLTFQAGCCVEVIEHLTPKMLSKLARDLSSIVDENALLIFNTGLTEYVKNEDADYLSPFERGHVCIWSVKSASKVFGPHGFAVMPIPGKTWAFAAEYKSKFANGDIRNRIWSPRDHNKRIIHDPTMGSVLYVLGLDAARAYQ